MDDETNWDLRLPCLMLAMFMKPLNTHHFPLMFGKKVQLPIDVMYGLPAGTGQPSQCTTLCLGAEEMDE